MVTGAAVAIIKLGDNLPHEGGERGEERGGKERRKGKKEREIQIL